ncbi:MAG: hypothetical protein OSJ72_11030 [Lachnospiraceae bacterium]|nr:hypothetical protein [Lachnospiraceae bacterium]
MKIRDHKKSYFIVFLIGMVMGILCRLTDFLPYEESLWSFPSVATLFGFWSERFFSGGQFQTNLFLVYSVLSVACGIGSYVLYFWNRQNVFNSFLYALPAGGMLAEAAACLIVLCNRHMLLAQTIFDLAVGMAFGIGMYRKAYHKMLYSGTVIAAGALVFLLVYQPFLLNGW